MGFLASQPLQAFETFLPIQGLSVAVWATMETQKIQNTSEDFLVT